MTPPLDPSLVAQLLPALLAKLLSGDEDGSALWRLLVDAEREALRAETINVPASLPKPYYQRGGITVYHGDATVIGLQLAAAGVKGFVCFDPAYSPHVHESARSNGKRRGVVGNKEHGTLKAPANRRRKKEISFDPLRPKVRRALARAAVALADGWIANFADAEGAWLWRLSFAAAAAEYVRTAYWRKIGSTPQTTGDRPAVSRETILLHHALGPKGRPHKKRWNGGGRTADYNLDGDEPLVYEELIVLDRGGSSDARVHDTQKHVRLMRRLLEDFCDAERREEPIIDLTAGSGSTGIAGLQLGRQAILVELKESNCAEIARRVDIWLDGGMHRMVARGQLALFGAQKHETPGDEPGASVPVGETGVAEER